MIIFLFILSQRYEDLSDINVWTFNQSIYFESRVDSAAYINSGYCKRAWFKYAHIPFNYFPLLSNIPPLLNERGALLEGGVQVANIQKRAEWPYDNPYDDDHLPPYEIPDPVFYDFATRNTEDSIYWIKFINTYDTLPRTFINIANENTTNYLTPFNPLFIDVYKSSFTYQTVSRFPFKAVP